MNIGIDLDNVLADFQTTYLAYHNRHYGTTLAHEDVTVYSYATVIGITTEEVMKRVYEFYDSVEFEDIKPEKGSEEAVKKLSEEHALYIVTSRPDKTIQRTQEWINRYFPQIMTAIIHTNQFSLDHDGNTTKATICRENGISVIIEDAPTYAEEVAEAGIMALLLDQPWNREIGDHENIIRVKSWKEIVREIGKMG